MPTPDAVADPDLQTFAGRVQALVNDFVLERALPVSEAAGSLIGAGVELSLRNGIDRAQIHRVVDLVVSQLERRASA
ncbi:MAG TPA: hypothetical protein VLE97_11165 [Gaiellaceae bacterium]|nr:hypothetical protein [Gaiellaceae bacterium]